MTVDRARCGVLVVAKAPVPGAAKTRIGAVVGDRVAAELAAAALLDTLDAVEAWAPRADRLLALTGSLAAAAQSREITSRLRAWTVFAQRGPTFASRLVSAHRDAARRLGASRPLIQIGMDTPSITGSDLDSILAPLVPGCDAAAGADVALGPAPDGGWWGLATRRAGYVDGLVDVPMSRSDTAAHTVTALEGAEARVELVHELRDVDDWADVVAVSAAAPHLRLAAVAAHLAAAVSP